MKAALILCGLACAVTTALARPQANVSSQTSSAAMVETNSPYDSIILHDGTNWTLVPQGALLHVPEGMLEHIVDRPLGNMMSWKEFLDRNQAWLGAESVTLRQAEGSEAIHASRIDYLHRQARMIVAVCPDAPVVVSAPDPGDLPQTAQMR
ncbi:hypothetical protein [Haloferula sargassicola]|uniref:Uncharacterized protein n=1 Tax=Haloferula sargassicola TaxID=490096 RepID=A0ABP9UPR4_9BACT